MAKKKKTNHTRDIFIQQRLKAPFLLLLLISVISVTGCFHIPYIFGQYDAVNKYLHYNSIFINNFFVHETPEVGDYSIFKSKYNDYKLWEIIHLNPYGIVIRSSIRMANPIREHSLFDYEYHIRYNGEIEKIFRTRRKDGKKKPIPIQKPGDDNYYLWTYSHDEKAETPLGTFNTQLFWATKSIGKDESICYVSYYNPSVVFCNVKTVIFSGKRNTNRFEIKEMHSTVVLIEYGNRNNHQQPSYLWIFNK